jgi:cholesterol transport system auxiliary component
MASEMLNRRLILLSASAFALAGCGGLGLGPANPDMTIYVLDPALPATAGGQPAGWALAVDIPDAADSLDTRRIALIKADNTLDYYANANWPDRLTLLVQTALVAAFEASGRVPQVSRTQDALHADYELGAELRDCAAHYSTPDGTPSVTVNLIAQMSTAHGRKIVSSFTASESAPASQNSTPAVVAAFNTALGQAVAKVVAWAVALPAPLAP